MNKSNLRILAAVSIALVLILFALQLNHEDSSTNGRLLLPELKSHVNDIDSLTVTRAGDDGAIKIVKQDENWVIASRDNYPADIGKLRELLLALTDAKIVEQKTANPEFYDQLGLRDPEVEGSKGTRIELHGAGEEYELIIGNAAQAGFRYVRTGDDPQSWLIDKNPDIPASTGEWLVRNIIDVKAADIRSVTISHPDGEEIRIEKPNAEGTGFEVTNLPAGRELTYATVTNSTTGVLSTLTLDDVRKAGKVPADAVTTTFETFDGTRIVVETEKSGDESWISLQATALESGDAAANEAEAQESDSDDDAEDQVESVDAINARVMGWQFKIPQYKANQLTRRWDDILKAETE